MVFGEIAASCRSDAQMQLMILVGESADFAAVVDRLVGPGLADLTALIESGAISIHLLPDDLPPLAPDRPVRVLRSPPACILQVVPELRLVG